MSWVGAALLTVDHLLLGGLLGLGLAILALLLAQHWLDRCRGAHRQEQNRYINCILLILAHLHRILSYLLD